jgi:FixJ family two-component response regulator
LSHSQANLFVIDDDESVRISLGRLLRCAGFECRAFRSAEEFLTLLRTDTHGCAIIDVHMPGMNGIELMNVLRSSGLNVQVILMTAFDDVSAGEAAARAGVVVLRKPFDDSTLLSAIGQATKPAPTQRTSVQ